MPPMHPQRWTRELEEAASEQEVVYVARDYAAFLTRSEISRLPEACRPGVIRDAADISSWGIEALRCKLAICPDTDSVSLILAVEGFLSSAMQRLAQIESMARQDDDGPAPEAERRH